jgi:hypothetical protein
MQPVPLTRQLVKFTLLTSRNASPVSAMPPYESYWVVPPSSTVEPSTAAWSSPVKIAMKWPTWLQKQLLAQQRETSISGV